MNGPEMIVFSLTFWQAVGVLGDAEGFLMSRAKIDRFCSDDLQKFYVLKLRL